MKQLQNFCINFNSEALSFIPRGGEILCACTITRLYHTFWVVIEGYVKLETWRSDTFLSAPSTRYKLMRSTSYSKVPVILVTLTLILFLFSYFEQTNHE